METTFGIKKSGNLWNARIHRLCGKCFPMQSRSPNAEMRSWLCEIIFVATSRKFKSKDVRASSAHFGPDGQRFRHFSLERLMDLLMALGRSVEIAVRSPRKERGQESLVLA